MNATSLPDGRTRGGTTVLASTGPRITLATMVQVADMEAVTGWLEIGPGAGVALSEGLVVDAWFGDLRGAVAFYELFTHPVPGALVLREAPIEPTAPIGPTSSLVLEASRRADDWRRIAGMPLMLDTDRELPELPEAMMDLLGSLDGETPLYVLVDGAGAPRNTSGHRLAPLVQTGVLVPVGPSVELPDAAPDAFVEDLSDESTASPATEGFPFPAVDDRGHPVDGLECLDRGRQALRGGDLDTAITWFRHAVAKRPDDGVAAQNLRRVRRLMEERA